MKFRSFQSLLITAVLALVTVACGPSEKPNRTTHFTGALTVADSIDASGDYSNINLLIIKKDSANADADTLFFDSTDKSGAFSGDITFKNSGAYPLFITRNGNRIASSRVLLGMGDTLRLNAELPGFNQTKRFSSIEYDAMNKFDRVDRSFGRMMRFIAAGKMERDTLPAIYNQWADLYWSVHEEYRSSLAGNNAALRSVNLLQNTNDSLMYHRFESVLDLEGVSVGMLPIIAKQKTKREGFSKTLNYLSEIESKLKRPSEQFLVASTRFDIAYDSLNLETADQIYAHVQDEYEDVNQVDVWLDYQSPYLNELRPGAKFPNFKLSLFGGPETIELDSLKGSPYVIEIARLNSRLYQDQFESLSLSYHLYKQFGVKVLTVPLDEASVVREFVRQAEPQWEVAAAAKYMQNGFTDNLHVRNVPDRFLIDAEGKIVKHYEYQELDDLVNDIARYIPAEEPNSNNQPSNESTS